MYLINFHLSLESKIAERLNMLATEQLVNYKLTSATDLYSLGVTLIHLLAPTQQIQELTDRRGRIKFQHLMPKDLSLDFINWLDTMVQPNRHERYADAATALKALQGIEFKRLPEVRGVAKTLELKATKTGEMLIQSFTISKFLIQSSKEAGESLCIPMTLFVVQETTLGLPFSLLNLKQIRCNAKS